jgi:hypothetical protein
MLKKVLLGIAVVVVALLGLVALQPASFSVSRSTTIGTAPAAVFAQVNDFHNWDTWSPWAKRDPAMKKTFAGAESGTGAIYTWAGNNEVGEGRMTITESKPAEAVRIQLEFIKPFRAENVTEFSFAPDGSGTAVKWTMSGRNNFLGKFISLFMNMDKMVGGDFETGLKQLKAVVEGGTK